MNGITKYVFKLLTKKYQPNRQRRKQLLNISDAKRIIVFANAKDYDVVRTLASGMREKGKKIEILLFGKSEVSVILKEGVEQIIPPRLFQLSGWLNEHSEIIGQKEADMLIDLSSEDSLLANHLLKLINASFTAAIDRDGLDFVDFRLGAWQELPVGKQFYHIENYLNVLTTKSVVEKQEDLPPLVKPEKPKRDKHKSVEAAPPALPSEVVVETPTENPPVESESLSTPTSTLFEEMVIGQTVAPPLETTVQPIEEQAIQPQLALPVEPETPIEQATEEPPEPGKKAGKKTKGRSRSEGKQKSNSASTPSLFDAFPL